MFAKLSSSNGMQGYVILVGFKNIKQLLALEALFAILVNQNFTMVSKKRDPELDSLKLITQVEVCMLDSTGGGETHM